MSNNDPTFWMSQYRQMSADWNELLRGLGRLGLKLHKQAATGDEATMGDGMTEATVTGETWGWAWGDTLHGDGYPTVQAAVLAAVAAIVDKLPDEAKAVI